MLIRISKQSPDIAGSKHDSKDYHDEDDGDESIMFMVRE